jgi:erythromycin esterase-like protein
MRVDEARDSAMPLAGSDDLDPLLDRIGDARYVLLGEASHGTHEFYEWRAELTRRLIAEKQFSFVAVEGDWPDCWRVSLAVTGASAEEPRAALDRFERWPTWMWANEEIVRFCRWLRDFNAPRPPEARVGFFGLDVYSLWDSLRAVLDYLHEHEPQYLPTALDAYRCFQPYGEEPQRYAMATRFVPNLCEDDVVRLLCQLREPTAAPDGPRNLAFAARQNAEVAAGAEAYYRAMVSGGAASWNIRDTHMADTLDRLVELYGPGAKAIVWEHNTHIGDAQYTDMAADGMVNVGQLVRQRHAEDGVVLVGFGCHRGSVIAAPTWGAPMQVMEVPGARPRSVEDLLHGADLANALFVFPPDDQQPDWLTGWLGHRAIGVVYRPRTEQLANYVPTVLGSRYDAFCWFDTTTALQPLHLERAQRGELEAFPTGA